MTKDTIQVIVIDPFKKEVREESIHNPKKDGNYTQFNQQIYDLMSNGPINVHCVEAVKIATAHTSGNNSILIDEEGLLHNFEQQQFFVIKQLTQPLAGIGVVSGCDSQGDSIAPTLTLDWIKKNVHFLTTQEITALVTRPW